MLVVGDHKLQQEQMHGGKLHVSVYQTAFITAEEFVVILSTHLKYSTKQKKRPVEMEPTGLFSYARRTLIYHISTKMSTLQFHSTVPSSYSVLTNPE